MCHPGSRSDRRKINENFKKSRNSHFKQVTGNNPAKLGRSVKTKPFDCGKPGCFCCHPESKDKHNLRKADQTFEEEIQ